MENILEFLSLKQNELTFIDLSKDEKIIGNNNIFDHIIYSSWFILYGDFNIFNYCYSYRNLDISLYELESDGFMIGGESNNALSYWFYWDNGNNGLNYAKLIYSSDLIYLHSWSWNNGNVNAFTGRYDFESGLTHW